MTLDELVEMSRDLPFPRASRFDGGQRLRHGALTPFGIVAMFAGRVALPRAKIMMPSATGNSDFLVGP